MLKSNNCVCPICYAPLRADQFTKVGPKVEFKLPQSYAETPFERPQTKEQKEQEDALSAVAQPDTDAKAQHQPRRYTRGKVTTATATATTAVVGPTGKLVILKGVVGSGKTTVAEQIKKQVEARGGRCWIEGTDKYCSKGDDPKTAVGHAGEHLREALASDAKDKVVVIDTCGEHNNGKKQMNYFGVVFKGWEKIDLAPHLTATISRAIWHGPCGMY